MVTTWTLGCFLDLSALISLPLESCYTVRFGIGVWHDTSHEAVIDSLIYTLIQRFRSSRVRMTSVQNGSVEQCMCGMRHSSAFISNIYNIVDPRSLFPSCLFCIAWFPSLGQPCISRDVRMSAPEEDIVRPSFDFFCISLAQSA